MHYVQVEGDGYEITVITGEETVETDRPGLVYVESGEWRVGHDLVLSNGQGAETDGPVWITGTGVIAIVEQMDGVNPELGYGHVFTRQVARTDKPWGYELSVDGHNRNVMLKRLHVEQGHRTSLQWHEHKHETMVYLDGTVIEIPPGKVHRVGSGEQPFDYFEGSTYHPDDTIRLEDDYGR